MSFTQTKLQRDFPGLQLNSWKVCTCLNFQFVHHCCVMGDPDIQAVYHASRPCSRCLYLLAIFVNTAAPSCSSCQLAYIVQYIKMLCCSCGLLCLLSTTSTCPSSYGSLSCKPLLSSGEFIELTYCICVTQHVQLAWLLFQVLVPYISRQTACTR